MILREATRVGMARPGASDFPRRKLQQKEGNKYRCYRSIASYPIHSIPF